MSSIAVASALLEREGVCSESDDGVHCMIDVMKVSVYGGVCPAVISPIHRCGLDDSNVSKKKIRECHKKHMKEFNDDADMIVQSGQTYTLSIIVRSLRCCYGQNVCLLQLPDGKVLDVTLVPSDDGDSITASVSKNGKALGEMTLMKNSARHFHA